MKQALRQKYKTLRAQLTEKEVENLSIKIAKNLFSQFDLEGENVSIFLPIKKFNEVNTWNIINQINANYFLPVVKGKALKHIKYENKDQLRLSDWGILEPVDGETVLPNQFDVVIVPLLAYDKKGNRIGYGAGFYDSFLKDCQPNCQIIGVSYFEPETQLIETYQTDIPLKFVVTPKQVYQF